MQRDASHPQEALKEGFQLLGQHQLPTNDDGGKIISIADENAALRTAAVPLFSGGNPPVFAQTPYWQSNVCYQASSSSSSSPNIHAQHPFPRASAIAVNPQVHAPFHPHHHHHHQIQQQPSPSQPPLLLPSPPSADLCHSGGDSTSVPLAQQQLSVIATPDADGDLPIHVAVAKENYPEVECLIHLMKRQNISLDSFNNLRQTPLHIAVIMNNIPIMKLLLENGASPKICDRWGNSSLHLGIKNCNKEFLMHFLSHIDCEEIINSYNYEGFAPLHIAVFQRDIQLVKVLACKNANMDVVDGTSGRSPLFHAVENGYEDIVELLLGLGANVNLPNYSGVTPLVIATDKGNKNITSMLISRGAMISCRDEY